MSTEGPNSPGTVVTDSSNGGDTDWGDAARINASDDDWAAISLGEFNLAYYLLATGFGFAIPGTATIDGIEVEVERKASAVSSVFDNEFHLIKAGVVDYSVNRAKAGTWPTTEAYESYGGSSDMWGKAWTPAQINASDFGVALDCFNVATAGADAFVDHVRITVHYTPAAGGPSLSQTERLPRGVNRGLALGAQ